jgi:N-acetylglucosamine kinase-like BadF-type ATPase
MRFLGIDAGASATQWVLYDGNEIVLRGTAGPIDGHISRPESRTRMHATLMQIASECKSEIAAITIGLTGIAETGNERAETLQIISEIFPGATLELLSDIHLAYRVHFGRKTGILLYAGTGAVACTKINDELVRVGGWGYLLGDEGAGYWIGREAIRALMIYIDRSEKPAPGSLEDDIAKAIEGSTWADVKKFVYGKNRSEIAALARIVFGHQSEESAVRILESAAKHLTELVHRVDEITGDRSLPVTFTGGTSRGEGPLNNLLMQQLAGRITISHNDIAEGAALLAKEASSQG